MNKNRKQKTAATLVYLELVPNSY